MPQFIQFAHHTLRENSLEGKVTELILWTSQRSVSVLQMHTVASHSVPCNVVYIYLYIHILFLNGSFGNQLINYLEEATLNSEGTLFII